MGSKLDGSRKSIDCVTYSQDSILHPKGGVNESVLSLLLFTIDGVMKNIEQTFASFS